MRSSAAWSAIWNLFTTTTSIYVSMRMRWLIIYIYATIITQTQVFTTFIHDYSFNNTALYHPPFKFLHHRSTAAILVNWLLLARSREIKLENAYENRSWNFPTSDALGTSTETLLVLDVEKMYSLQHRIYNVGWCKYQQGMQCVSITGGSTQRDKSSLIYYHNRPTTLGRDKQFFSSVMYIITVFFFFLNFALDSHPVILSLLSCIYSLYDALLWRKTYS